MSTLDRFGDILIDLNDVRCLVGTVVIFKDGTKHDVGVKAADAMRGIFTPAEDQMHEQHQDTHGKSKEQNPSSTLKTQAKAHQPSARSS